MPKLPIEKIVVKTVNDGDVIHEARVNVNTSGQFSVALPEALRHEESVSEFFGETYPHSGYAITYSKDRHWISGPLLKKCVEIVKAIIAHHYSVKTSTEDVLVYRYSSGLRYWRNPDGTITHNGTAEDADRDGKWAGDTRQHPSWDGKDHEADGIVLAAFAMVKKTHARGKSKTVEWAFWRNANLQDDSDIRTRLNALSPAPCPEDPENDSDWVITPYDPKAAQFFYTTIHSLCRIDDQLRAFFSNRKKVAAAIESGAPLKLM